MNEIINRVFYTLKPLIPRSVQIALRRQIARYKRRKYAHIWPIDPAAGEKPPGWPGWPDGKQFALVLIHDVDTAKGYRDVLNLAEIEEKLGFRSCFNFVPERYGKIELSLLDELRRRGFDIAIHGLKHDGKLFLSKKIFNQSAVRINAYLSEWRSRGFSSPSMHHNLDWLSRIDIDYAISTFDTDPFEPQPDGVHTIFPFAIPRGISRKSGVSSQLSDVRCTPFLSLPASHLPSYLVELPYTLPQDHLLFVILQETGIDVWRRKIDWIAEKGGMALVNTHSDYMAFNGELPASEQYPVQHYINFLEDIRNRHSNNYHHALPREIAAFFLRSCPVTDLRTDSESVCCKRFGLSQRKLRNKPDQRGDLEECNENHKFNEPNQRDKRAKRFHRPLRVAMLSYSFYESDNRVRRYAETLVRRGDSVDIISLRREGQSDYNVLNGVRVFRVQKRLRDERSKWSYFFRILRFFSHSAALLTFKHIDRSYDLIHVHSVPDFEVFAAIVPKLLGARVILDIHDIVPELYCSKFKARTDSVIFKTLVLAEKASIGFCDHVIISNDLWRERLVSRSVVAEKCTSILNYPDDNLFCTNGSIKNGEKTILLYPGTLNHHQGLDIAITAFVKIKDKAPNAEFHIYGDGPAKAGLVEQVRLYGLQDRVFLNDPVPLDEIVDIMAKADIGVIPKKDNGFGGEAFSTKTLEFMTLGVPIIVSRTRIDQFYFNESMVKFFDPDNIDDLAEAMLKLINDRLTREQLSVTALEFAKKSCWGLKKDIYLNLVDTLCQKADGKRYTA